MNYEDIFRIQFFTKNGHFDFDPFFLCIWAEIPLYLKYGESRVDLSSKVKIFAFSNYTIPTELHSIGKIWLAGNLVFLTHPKVQVQIYVCLKPFIRIQFVNKPCTKKCYSIFFKKYVL